MFYYKTNHVYQFGSSPHPVHFLWLQLSKCNTINLTCRQLLFLFLHQLRVPLHVTYDFTLMYQPCYCLLFQSLTGITLLSGTGEYVLQGNSFPYFCLFCCVSVRRWCLQLHYMHGDVYLIDVGMRILFEIV